MYVKKEALKRKALFALIISFIIAAVNARIYVSIASASEYYFTVTALDRTYNFTRAEIGVKNGIYYLKNAEEVIDGIYLDTLVKPVDAVMLFSPNAKNKFKIIAGKKGLKIDKFKLASDVSNALNSGKKKVVCQVESVDYDVKEEYLSNFTNLRSAFTTYYGSSNIERKSNIKLASDAINGVCLKENEIFSFNDVVGERTEERGYLASKVIVDGNFTSGLGGGVCQVSTTLYNAALLSGVRICERHAHSLRVSYVEPSFDAMVSYGVSDLKFINDTGGKIYIAAYANDDALKIEIYGKKMTEEYERTSVITEEVEPPSQQIIYSGDLTLGERRVEQRAKNGVKSEGYLATYKNGERVKTIKLQSDFYKPLREIIVVGTKSD